MGMGHGVTQVLTKLFCDGQGAVMRAVLYTDTHRGYKTFLMLNSVEHDILDAHMCKNIKKFGFFRLR